MLFINNSFCVFAKDETGRLKTIQDKKNAKGFRALANGSIVSRDGQEVGNTTLGDRVNDDGSFTAANGVTITPEGEFIYPEGYKQGTSVAETKNFYQVANNDIEYEAKKETKVQDENGATYYTDGTITFADGSKKDSEGVIHHKDGSVTLANGVTYFVDGSVQYDDGTIIYNINKEDIDSIEEKEGYWRFDPINAKWIFSKLADDGEIIECKNAWVLKQDSNGKQVKFLIDEEGRQVTGWARVKGLYYYLSPQKKNMGEAVKGEQTIDKKVYEFDSVDNHLIKGEIPHEVKIVGEKNHICGQDGEWKNKNGKKYFVEYVDGDKSRQKIATKKYMIDGKYYYLDDEGIPTTGLVKYENRYYYFNDDGTMFEGEEKVIGNKVYKFDKATGACKTLKLLKK